MQNVLVTGGAGFIGSHVVEALISRGCQVSVFDNLSFGRREHLPGSIRLIEGDIIDRDAVIKAISNSFDTVIHLAAIHFIPYCNQHPNLACRTNIEGTQNVFDAVSLGEGVRRLFVASTAAVYPDSAGAIDEAVRRAPLDVYGMTKSANEEQASILSRRSSIRISIGRFFNAVGGRETNPHLVPDILSRLNSSNSIEIGNVAPKRDYIDVRDMAHAVLAMLDLNEDPIDVCNIGTGVTYSVDEIVQIIAKVHRAPIALQVAERLIRKVERLNLQADPGKLMARYKWRPQFSTADALAYAYEWYVKG